MSRKVSVRQSFALLSGTISCLFKNPEIFYPFAILAFLQLLLMQILFFAPRFPLSVFFGPIIARVRGDAYMQYPLNFDLLNHWFQSAQIVVFLFASSLMIAKAVLMIARINRGEAVGGKMPAVGFKKYVNLVAAFVLILFLMHGLTSLYGLLVRRAIEIRSVSGVYFWLKQGVVLGAPYFNLFFSIVISTLFAYLVPLIVLDGKNIFSAVFENFRLLIRSFFPLLVVIAGTSLLYLPILLIRSNYRLFSAVVTPEGWQIFVIFGIFVMLFIDAVHYTVITLCYFLTKDE